MVGVEKVYLLELNFGTRSDFALQPAETSFQSGAREISRKNLDTYAARVPTPEEINYVNMVHRQMLKLGNHLDVTT